MAEMDEDRRQGLIKHGHERLQMNVSTMSFYPFVPSAETSFLRIRPKGSGGGNDLCYYEICLRKEACPGAPMPAVPLDAR